MGMYTEFHYNVELKQDTPQEVINILKFMLGDEEQIITAIDHVFFSSARWRWLFIMDSYYFAADTHSTLRYDDIAKGYYLNVKSNIKNYDSEIEKFIDFINPYVCACDGDFIGFYRYEESNEPVLIYKQKGA